MNTPFGRAVKILSVLGLAAFVGAWNLTFLAPVLPDVAEDTGVSVTVAGQRENPIELVVIPAGDS